jgi:CspA family cold shock protein
LRLPDHDRAALSALSDVQREIVGADHLNPAAARVAEEAPGMMHGTVSSFESNGFGFIAPDAGGPEHVVRLRSVACAPARGLAAGERVEFELEFGAFGLEAVNVRPLVAVEG